MLLLQCVQIRIKIHLHSTCVCVACANNEHVPLTVDTRAHSSAPKRNERTCGDLDNLGISQRHQTTSPLPPILTSHAPRTHCLGLGIAQHCRQRQRQLAKTAAVPPSLPFCLRFLFACHVLGRLVCLPKHIPTENLLLHNLCSKSMQTLCLEPDAALNKAHSGT